MFAQFLALIFLIVCEFIIMLSIGMFGWGMEIKSLTWIIAGYIGLTGVRVCAQAIVKSDVS